MTATKAHNKEEVLECRLADVGRARHRDAGSQRAPPMNASVVQLLLLDTLPAVKSDIGRYSPTADRSEAGVAHDALLDLVGEHVV